MVDIIAVFIIITNIVYIILLCYNKVYNMEEHTSQIVPQPFAHSDDSPR